MIQVGQYNTLRVVKAVDFGVYLDGGDTGEILLPGKYVPQNTNVDDEIEVFIYHDSEDRLIATTEEPYIMVGEFAFLETKMVNHVGAFLDWGITAKDLFVPFAEQRATMREGGIYLVYAFLDEMTGRIVASSKVDKFLDNTPPQYTLNQEVELLVVQETELGYKVIVDNKHWGMIYKNEIFTAIEAGDFVTGYIKKVRDDDKLDISLQPVGYKQAVGDGSLSQRIMQQLQQANGFLPYGDKTDAQVIADAFGCSKKNFKKAIGALYKAKQIVITPQGIKIVAE
ncbi:MAG: GntR family transcriptional regulator [Bacteroidaceae bacterium]|nr:GntR family transcriptional regulator [Bacteroidaceae bacterium]